MKFVSDEMKGRYLVEVSSGKLVIGTTRGLRFKDGTFSEKLSGAKIVAGAFSGRQFEKSELDIPEGVFQIEDGAFSGCSTLTSVLIPKTTVLIGAAFTDCPNIESLTVAEDNLRYKTTNDCIIDIDNSRLVMGCKNSVIPTDGSVKQIAALAFLGCTGLTEIAIPSCITDIYNNVFRGCTGLTTVTVESEAIANNSFINLTAQLFVNAERIYVKDTITLETTSVIAKDYVWQNSDKDGYEMYVKAEE